MFDVVVDEGVELGLVVVVEPKGVVEVEGDGVSSLLVVSLRERVVEVEGDGVSSLLMITSRVDLVGNRSCSRRRCSFCSAC